MGTIFSSPDDPNPNTTAATTFVATSTTANSAGAMSQTRSENPTNPDQENTSKPPKTLKTPVTLNLNQESKNPNQEYKNPNQESSKPVKDNDNPNQELEEEEEEGECPFCAYMKGGECKETLINWEKCIEEAKNNGEGIVDKCVEVTSALKKCMEANQDY
uniref:GCK-like protein n=1 Tax=Tanacetum cinerariifolium TaxID=118510 RepID=A0A6L2MK65_TANCI|nr:GCK-like protein [Tanacetum cinerariifolium]